MSDFWTGYLLGLFTIPAAIFVVSLLAALAGEFVWWLQSRRRP